MLALRTKALRRRALAGDRCPLGLSGCQTVAACDAGRRRKYIAAVRSDQEVEQLFDKGKYAEGVDLARRVISSYEAVLGSATPKVPRP